ncbi:hypothetical protein J5X84_26325 [Streptosporangiaceae bacterium NEAU-GS5]|nr:hypothetical protein [Streptosporangiaceae bacterium NEAU-GS5]
MNPEELRTLLVTATEDRPAGIKATFAPPARRRIPVLVPALAALTVAAAVLVGIVGLPGTTPSAQAQVVSAVDNTGHDSYRLRAVTGEKHWEGAFDPVQDIGIITNTGSGSETRVVDGKMYSRQDATATWEVRPLADAVPPEASALTRLVKLSALDPQAALAALRTVTDVHESGSASGDGWTGKRFEFSLADANSSADGTVDVDDQGRVRQLDMVFDDGQHNVLTFSDFGTAVEVTAPPADQVVADSGLPDPKKS